MHSLISANSHAPFTVLHPDSNAKINRFFAAFLRIDRGVSTFCGGGGSAFAGVVGTGFYPIGIKRLKSIQFNNPYKIVRENGRKKNEGDAAESVICKSIECYQNKATSSSSYVNIAKDIKIKGFFELVHLPF